MPGQHRRRLAGQCLVRLEAEERERVAGGAVQRAQAAVVVVLTPKPVLATAGTEHRRRLSRRLRPALLAGPLTQRQQREQRPRNAPVDVVGRVLGTRREEGVEVVGKHRVSGELERDEQRPRFAQKQRGRMVVRFPGLDVWLGSEELKGPSRCRGQVERRLGAALAAKRVKGPDHARGADVQALQRQRGVARIPLVRGPERIGGKRRIRVRHDRRDRILGTRRSPRLVDQRLELRRLVEHSCDHASSSRSRQLPMRQPEGLGTPRRPRREDRIS